MTRQIGTRCCIAGGGPAGMMLAYLLARAGVDVVLLEKHADFLRDFRGDTIHPSTLDVIAELGLLERFLELPHAEIERLDVVLGDWRFTPVDFSTLRTSCAFLGLMPQWDFLRFLREQADELPCFTVLMEAEVTDLLWRDRTGAAARAGADGGGQGLLVDGVLARTPDGPVEVWADLTVAADGRASTVRERAGLHVREFGVPVDVLWFRLPKPADAPPPTLAYVSSDFVLTIDRGSYYQAGMLIPKESFGRLRSEGMEAFRGRIATAAPVLGPVVGTLEHWDQIKVLTVQVNRLDRWHRPGLLCIGDAAHAMSPVFGVGVNYAVQDAVAAANLLAARLRARTMSTAALACVQRRRELPVRLMRPLQLAVHRQIVRLPGSGVARQPPRWLRLGAAPALPLVRALAARLVGLGFRPEHVRSPQAQ